MSARAFLVFDLDGTISDPTVGIHKSINYALQYFGHKPVSVSEVSKYIGPPIESAFSHITGSSSSEHLFALVSKYRERYSEVGFSENTLYSGVSEALQQLADAAVPIGLCTSKRVDFAERILALFGLRQHFGFMSGGEIGITKRRQLSSLLESRTISNSSVMIGDRAVDIEAAKFNGLASVGVLWGHGTLDELVAANPGAFLSSPYELVELKSMV